MAVHLVGRWPDLVWQSLYYSDTYRMGELVVWFFCLFFLTFQISSPRLKNRSFFVMYWASLFAKNSMKDRQETRLFDRKCIFCRNAIFLPHVFLFLRFIIYLFFNNNIHECHCLINLSSLESCFTSCSDPSAADLLLFHRGFIRICCSIGSNFFFFNSPSFPSWVSDLHFNAANWTSLCSLIPN